MPTYEYRCRECERGFEVFQRMSDPPGAPCPACGRRGERLISGGAGFLFRGDGFYITDHRSEEYRRKARAEAGGDGEKKGGDAGGGEAGKPSPDRAGKPAEARPGSAGGEDA